MDWLDRLPPDLRDLASAIAGRVAQAGGRAYLVGGSVRDLVLGRPVLDLDLEVYGIEAERVPAALGSAFPTDLVGRSFGVFKVRGQPVDIALPRRERRTGPRHQDFAIEGDPWLDPGEAASRRDFTVNAILLSLHDGTLLDPCGGVADLGRRLLRHASGAFVEDPLRVLRAMQLAARLRFDVDPSTVRLAATLDPGHLPAERLMEEWRKLVVLGEEPSRGLRFLREAGWLAWFPELRILVDCPQDPGWHPEGDVWIHTLHVMDAFARARLGDPWEDLVVGLACLCHDLGKPLTTFTDADGRIRSPGHEEAGVKPTLAFLGRLTREARLVDEVVPLVREHLRPVQLHKEQAGDAAIRRLAGRVGRVDRLLRVVAADLGGRPPLPADHPCLAWLAARAAELAVDRRPAAPLVQGRHLLELGLAPGPHFKRILDACYEAQLDGAFGDLDGGRRFLAGLVGRGQG